jgi:hypothetical protein
MGKKQEIEPFPQRELDLMFWQYVQGAKDVLESLPSKVIPTAEDRAQKINTFIKTKLVHIQKMHSGRRPSFDIKAEIIMGEITLKKIPI